MRLPSPRTLIALVVASSLVTIGLNAAGVFGHDSRHFRSKKPPIGVIANLDDALGEVTGPSRELPVALARTTAGGDEFVWVGVAQPGQALEVRNILGTITAQPATGDSIRVVATREGGGRSDVQVKVLDRGNRITVCAAHPRGEASNETVGCGTAVLTLNGRKQAHSDARVNFVILVPRGMRLIARAVDGQVNASGLQGDVEVTTVNGDVEIETAGAAEAKTMNGNIDATVGKLASSENKFETLHGNVTVHLPATTAAAVRAESVTGAIQTDLPIQPTERRRTRLVGTLGAGGPALVVKTVAGDVSLRRTP